VEAPRVVERLDVVEDCRARLGARGPRVVVDQLVLQGAEEAVDHRIVGAVAFPTHAGHEAVPCEQRLVGRGSVLASLIRMVGQPRRGPALPQDHGQGVEDQPLLGAVAHSPADDPP